MQFQTAEELQKIAELLKESDFDRAEVEWSPEGGVFNLRTSRPPAEPKAAGLFRKQRKEWMPCRLTFQNVRSVSIWEEYDAPPPAGLIQIEEFHDGFRALLSSPHSLRMELTIGRLKGSLEDL